MLWHKLIAFAVFSLVLAQLHQASSDQVASGCKSNFTRVGDKCLLIVNNPTNWYQSDRYCRSLGAGLLSLQNATQLQQINKFLEQNSQVMVDYWTSGNCLGDNRNNKNAYHWQSTGKQATYLPWSPGQPQPIWDCLLIYSDMTYYANYGLWVYNCESMVSFICEHEPQQSTNTTITASRICLKPGSYETAQVIVN